MLVVDRRNARLNNGTKGTTRRIATTSLLSLAPSVSNPTVSDEQRLHLRQRNATNNFKPCTPFLRAEVQAWTKREEDGPTSEGTLRRRILSATCSRVQESSRADLYLLARVGIHYHTQCPKSILYFSVGFFLIGFLFCLRQCRFSWNTNGLRSALNYSSKGLSVAVSTTG